MADAQNQTSGGAGASFIVQPDLDKANVALVQAAAVLDMLAAFAEVTESDLPGTEAGNLVHSLYTAKSELDRARHALFGPDLSHMG